MTIKKIQPFHIDNTQTFVFGNLSATGNAVFGDVSTVKISGGTTGQYLKTDGTGNLSWAAGGGGGGGTSLVYTAATTPPISGNNLGDQWYNTSTQTLYEYMTDGTGTYWIDVQSPSISTNLASVLNNGNSNVVLQANGSFLVSATGTSNVLVVSNTAATVTGNVSVTGNISGNNLTITNNITVANVSATGNITANNFNGNLVAPKAVVANGVQTTANYSGTYTSGVVVDYVSGTGRISVGTNEGVSFYKNGVGNTSIYSVDSNGNATVTGTLSVASTTLLTGATTIQLTSEIYSAINGATGVVVHDLALGGTFYHTAPAASFTPNFVNVPTTDLRIIVTSLIISQGATAYLPTAMQIGGVAQTIKWLSGQVPSGSISKTDVLTFSLQRVGTNWIVYGQSVSYS